jgi:beta-glucosidase
VPFSTTTIRRSFLLAGAVVAFTMTTHAQSAAITVNKTSTGNYPFNNPALTEKQRVDNLLSLLTVEEKAGFFAGRTLWNLHGVDRLGIPSVQVTDCGHGVTVILGHGGDFTGCATCFPTGVGQAATWDESIIRQVGAAIARETRALGSSILLAPMVNIHRLPIGGRNYETYSEDPFLTGQLATAFVKGVQSEHIGAVIKAFAGNNQQEGQEHLDAVISDRALHEIYFPAFRMAISGADPVGLMTSYNGVNGSPTSESNLLIRQTVKTRWGFKGFIVSDWRAVVSKNSVDAGLDMEMPGPGKFMDSTNMLAAIKQGTITRQEADDRVGRYLRFMVRSKLLDNNKPILHSAVNTPGHQALARQTAEGSIVLLKNQGALLPLRKSAAAKIAVFGPNATEARLGGGGSASVSACYTIGPLKGLRNFLGTDENITFVEGTSLKGSLPAVPAESLTTNFNGTTVHGLRGEYFSGSDLKGVAQCARVDEKVDFSWGWANPCKEVSRNEFSARWVGKISAPVTGTYKLGLSFNDAGIRLFIDGKLVINEWGDPAREVTEAKFVNKSKYVDLELVKGSSHDIAIEFHKKANKNTVRLEWRIPDNENPIEDAVRLAKKSDVAIVFAGLSNLFEGGMNDRKTLDLPGDQNKLIEAVASANPNTIVVLINGTPVTMPWINKVKSVVEAFYPGQEGGNSIARVLFGEVNPSGKLPDTYPVRLEDNKAMLNYPGVNGTVRYEEGIYIGYRQFERDGIKPLFPFGFGLSYTTFSMDKLVVKKTGKQTVELLVRVTNTGKVAGAEVVQVYVHDVKASVDRPVKELKGFDKVFLEPNESKTVRIKLDKYAFSFFSEKTQDWVLEPGDFTILIGNSSDNMTLKSVVHF